MSASYTREQGVYGWYRIGWMWSWSRQYGVYMGAHVRPYVVRCGIFWGKPRGWDFEFYRVDPYRIWLKWRRAWPHQRKPS